MNLNRSFKNILSLKLSYSPWAFFILFLAADALLVFAPLPLTADLAILLFGILVPFVVALVLLLKNPVPLSDKVSFFHTEWFEVGPWLWILFAVLFMITRFYKLTTLPWPVTEDGYVAYYANRLVTQGDWRILYGCAQMEPLYIWGLAAWFKLLQSSLLALKTYPIILYVGVLTAAYWGARRYFSKAVSFVALWFLAFNFWAFIINRKCHASGGLLFFECLALYLLGGSLLSPPHGRAKFFWLLALCIGIGFYSYTAWPVVAFMAALPIILKTKSEFSLSGKKLIAFILIPLILVLPLLYARFLPSGVSYIQSLVGYPAGLDYLEVLFWNGLRITKVDPSNLGWLNPCLGALFLVGFLELWRCRLFPWAQWVLGAFLLFLLPGALTIFFEIYRITALLPLICILAALGFNAILSEFHFSKGKNIFVFFLLAFLSLGFDIYHYDGPGQLNDWNYWIGNKRHFESVDFSRAYPVLETAHRNGISLSLLINLNNNNNCDQTLNVVTTPFDNVRNLGVSNYSGQKAALLVNSNYEPFLKKEFPDSDWRWLSPDLPNDYGGFMLGFISIDSRDETIMQRWKKADDAFKQNTKIFMESTPNSADVGLKDLYTRYPIFQGDRFLESVFWDKVAFYKEFRANIPAAIAALKNGAKDGYPSAQLFEETGELSAYLGYKKEGQDYFEKAIGCPVNRTSAAEKLKQLKSI